MEEKPAQVKIIDARMGAERKVGDEWTDEWLNKQLLAVEEDGLFKATAVMVQQTTTGLHEPELVYVPLQVRYTHPSYFLQKVAFIPS